MAELIKNLQSLQDAISLAIKNNIALNKEVDKEKSLYNYNEKQRAYYLENLRSKLRSVKSSCIELHQCIKFDIKNEPPITQILELMPELDDKDLKKLEKTVKKIFTLASQLNLPKIDLEKSFSMPSNTPLDIKSDIKADIDELNKCFSNSCYRSSIILCGRLLETALHRKYYELTKTDLLEKSPGIGLGNIISKLKENNIQLDPGLTNQIHLINQVRVFSVHKKKEAFYPTKQQTQATILYTLDALEKLF